MENQSAQYTPEQRKQVLFFLIERTQVYLHRHGWRSSRESHIEYLELLNHICKHFPTMEHYRDQLSQLHSMSAAECGIWLATYERLPIKAATQLFIQLKIIKSLNPNA